MKLDIFKTLSNVPAPHPVRLKPEGKKSPSQEKILGGVIQILGKALKEPFWINTM